jgi:hypothetical protein
VVVSTGGSAPFTAAALNVGVTLYAEGVAPSSAVDDVILKLELFEGPTRGVNPPITANLTSIELFLEIHQSRTAPGVDPAALAVPNKVTDGRVVHRQHGGSHGRALVIVRKAVPNTWPNNMELRAFDARVRLFDDAGEVPPAGGAVVLPLTIPNGPLPPTGRRFWAEGVTVSGGLADTGLKLGVPGLSRDGDWVRMTVVEFSDLRATVPATAPFTTRGNVPSVHTFNVAAGRRFEEDFVRNQPLVLIENSILDAKLVHLSVKIAPAGVPVFWKIQRAQPTGAARPQDHADVVALSANPEPTLNPIGTNTLAPTLKADAVGSFYIHAYVDCNGTSDFERDTPAGIRIDREPYIVMNMVLVHMELDRDDSTSNSVVFTGVSDGANGISVTSGGFNTVSPGQNAIRMSAQLSVVGGGADGKLGLTRVFAGWINTALELTKVATYTDTSVAPALQHRLRSISVSNVGAATGPAATFLPGVAPGPIPRALPLLDVGPARAPEGTGGERACLTLSTFVRGAGRAPLPGQFFRARCIDSPAASRGAMHPGFPAGLLTDFRFQLGFRAALCVWTGSRSSGPKAANRLYSVAREYEWKMRGHWTINPVTGAVARVGVPSVAISNDVTHTPADPVEGVPGIEVRFPTAIQSDARDGTT